MVREIGILKLIVNDAIKESPTLVGLKGDIGQLKTQLDDHGLAITSLQTDVRMLRSSIATHGQEISLIRQETSKMNEKIGYLGVTMEAMSHKMDLVIDALRPAKERAAEVDQVFAKVDDHEYRLAAVETVIKEQSV